MKVFRTFVHRQPSPGSYRVQRLFWLRQAIRVLFLHSQYENLLHFTTGFIKAQMGEQEGRRDGLYYPRFGVKSRISRRFLTFHFMKHFKRERVQSRESLGSMTIDVKGARCHRNWTQIQFISYNLDQTQTTLLGKFLGSRGNRKKTEICYKNLIHYYIIQVGNYSKGSQNKRANEQRKIKASPRVSK